MNIVGRIQLWRERISKDFDKISGPEENSYELGDLLLRETEFGAYHAGVYCGNNEVLDFMASERKMQAVGVLNTVHDYGVVTKKSVGHFKCRKPLEVYRLRARDRFPASFNRNVTSAMDMFIHYHLINFNCLHFALCVLEVLKWHSESFGPDGYETISMEEEIPV